MSNYLFIILLSLVFCFGTTGCQILKLNTHQKRENAEITLEMSSYLFFSEFIDKKESLEERKKLALQVRNASNEIILIKENQENKVSEVVRIITEINNDYPDELRYLANNIERMLRNQFDLRPIDEHFFLVTAVAKGAYQATISYGQFSK